MRVTCEDESNVFQREEKTEDQDQHNSFQRITPGFFIEKLVIFSINKIFINYLINALALNKRLLDQSRDIWCVGEFISRKMY